MKLISYHILIFHPSGLIFHPFEKSIGVLAFVWVRPSFQTGYNTHIFGHTSICHFEYFGPHDEWNEDSQRIQALYLVHLGPHKMLFLGTIDKSTR